MEDNKNSFSASGEGYNKEEVDAYFHQVRKQFEKLSAENKKLHRDCVNFARQLKKIQDSGVLDEDVPELKRQNAQYRKEIASLQNQLNAAPSAPQAEPVEAVQADDEDRGYFNTPSEPATQPEQDKTGGAVFFDDEPVSQDIEKAPRPKKKKSHKVLRGFMIFFLVVFIILGIISVVSAAIGHSKNPNTTFFGTRAYTVHNNNMATIADNGDIVFVKKDNYNNLKTGTVIVAVPKDRSLAKVDDKEKGSLIVSGDNGKEYTVTPNQYLGVAKYKVENIGSFVKWAVNNAVIYFLVLCVIIAILILIIAVIPSGKKNQKISG